MAPECSYPVSGSSGSAFVWAEEVPAEPRAEDGSAWLRGRTARDFLGVTPSIYHYDELPERASEFRSSLDPALREDPDARMA